MLWQPVQSYLWFIVRSVTSWSCWSTWFQNFRVYHKFCCTKCLLCSFSLTVSRHLCSCSCCSRLSSLFIRIYQLLILWIIICWKYNSVDMVNMVNSYTIHTVSIPGVCVKKVAIYLLSIAVWFEVCVDKWVGYGFRKLHEVICSSFWKMMILFQLQQSIQPRGLGTL